MAAAFARTPRASTSTIAKGTRDEPRPVKRRKDAPRADIWTSLLRQTREAQARSRTSTVQHRSLILCGGSPDDQLAFVRHNLARPPPAAPPSRNRDQRPQRQKGEVKLRNRLAYGYGHVTLYLAPQQGVGVLGAEAEEVGRLEIHTLPEPEEVYEATLRRLLVRGKRGIDVAEDAEDGEGFEDGVSTIGGEEDRRPAVCLLLSWKEPWRFLALLRRWLQLLARSLLPSDAPTDDPLDVLKDHHISLNVVVQDVEAQESLEREGYKEDTFDYISQCLRTCLLSVSAALVYTPSNPPPQQSGSPLSDVQKVLFKSLDLDITALSPAPGKSATGSSTKREDLAPKHNVVDRMAIVVPRGWDSVGKIRLLSETFSPEAVLEAWTSDLNVPSQPSRPAQGALPPQAAEIEQHSPAADETEQRTTSGAEQQEEQAVYATFDAGPETEVVTQPVSNPNPQSPHSALHDYESVILDPNAHRAPKPPMIEVTTTPDQAFLAEMRAHVQELDATEADKSRNPRAGDGGVSSTAFAASGRVIGMPTGEQTGALNALGDVSFNVGGVSYSAATAEAAIERLKQRDGTGSGTQAGESSPTTSATPRTSTPRPPRREERETSLTSPLSQASSTGKGDLPVDKLEEYFHSLMKKGGGGGSASSTPSKGH